MHATADITLRVYDSAIERADDSIVLNAHCIPSIYIQVVSEIRSIVSDSIT